MEANFKFGIDQKVRVEKIGLFGIVAMCAVERSGNTYYIKARTSSDWYNEDLLVSAEDEKIPDGDAQDTPDQEPG